MNTMTLKQFVHLIILAGVFLLSGCVGEVAIEISEPTGSQVFTDKDEIRFRATANDRKEGDLSESVSWLSDIDGELGVGAELILPLSAGVHTITASVKNSRGVGASTQLELTVKATTGTASIIWNAPLENSDGSQLDDLVGFNIHYGTSEEVMDQVISVEGSHVRSWVIEGLAVDTTYYFAVTAVNSQGVESLYSELVTKLIRGD